MSLSGLMRHRVDLYRPSLVVGADADTIGGYGLVASSVPAFVQPADGQLVFFYQQRGLEVSHTVYSSDVHQEFRREDVLEFNGRQFHVVGVLNGLESSVYVQLTCLEWPEGAKKRLDTGVYP